MPLTPLQPNEHGDWISVRNDNFSTYIPIDSDKKFNYNSQTFFIVNSRGWETGRDAWIYNSSKIGLNHNIKSSVDFYNNEVERYTSSVERNNDKIADFINKDTSKISWPVLASNRLFCVVLFSS